jgi:hypothetical protein
MRDIIAEIKSKCEQYWNEANICDEEIHAILEFIHVRCSALDTEHANLMHRIESDLHDVNNLLLAKDELVMQVDYLKHDIFDLKAKSCPYHAPCEDRDE